MKIVRSRFLLAIVLLLSIEGSAQQVHYELWNRIFLNHEFKSGYRLETEYNFRTQNKPYSSIIPETHLAHLARIWIYRKSGNWRFGLSPFAVMRNYPSINTENDFTKSNSWEFRWAVNAEYNLKKGAFGFRYRPVFEDRLSKADNSDQWKNSLRMRNRIMIEMNGAKIDSSLAALTVSFGDEHFFRTEDVIHNRPAFDQNRIFAGAAWKFNKMFTLSATAFLIHRSGTAGYNQHRMLWLNFIIDI